MRKHRRKFSRFLAAFLSAALLTQPGMTVLGAVPDAGGAVGGKPRTATDSNASESDRVATASNAGISVMSLLPLEEREATLTLNFYSEEELSAVPLKDLLDMMVDENGDPVEIPEEANIVWTYLRDENGNVLEDEYRLQDRDVVLDMRPEYYSSSYNWSYEMEMIVGSGKQLDPGNIRYHVQVVIDFDRADASLFLGEYSSDELSAMPLETILTLLTDAAGEPIEIPEDAKFVWYDYNGDWTYHLKERNETVDLSTSSPYRDFYLIAEDSERQVCGTFYSIRAYYNNITVDLKNPMMYQPTSQGDIWPDDVLWERLGKVPDTDIQMTWLTCIDSEYEEGDEYSLVFNAEIDGDAEGFQIDVYPMENFLDYYRNGADLTGAITDVVLNGNEEDYLATFDSIPEDFIGDNVFCFVFSDKEKGAVLGYFGVVVTVEKESVQAEGRILAYENGTMKDVGERSYYSGGGINKMIFRAERGNVAYQYSNYNNYFYLEAGYPENATYYYVLKDGTGVEKVVKGAYESIASAEALGAEDITDQILPSDTDSAPYGYAIDFGETPFFEMTVFLEDGIRHHHSIWLYETAPEDIYFMINSVKKYTSWMVEPDMDTYYDMGYQTGFILDEDADLAHLVPYFYAGADVRVHSGTEQISGQTENDFSDGTVTYKATLGDTERQYFVTFAKKEQGPKLFVNGPDTREVFLTDYYDNRHDILVANIGSEALTGLKAELIDATHVKLDDYWNIGGENNETLEAFESVSTSSMANLAKVRLVPDGEGEISGTLKISADGQEDVLIELQGFAGNPEITTESLADGVKFVPYSFMIDTSNIHSDWIKVSYSLEGTLPDGVTFNTSTGEIYGVPQETGEFPITVTADFNRKEFVPSTAEFVLTVNENTNENVYMETDEGYLIETPLGKESTEGSYDFVVTSTRDQLFVSAGTIDEFIDFWLNGEKLTDGVDYEKESGSTRITIKSQTFKNKTVSGANTIAAEFRVDGDRDKELKRTAQNFRLDLSGGDDYDEPDTPENPGSSGDSGNNGSSGNDSDNDSDNSHTTVYRPNDTSTPSYTDASWLQDENGWKCQKPDGTLLTDTWQQIPYNGTLNWYFFDEQGYMMTGWLNRGGSWYYLNPASDGTRGRMMTGWQYIGDIWYYFGENDAEEGKMVSEGWHYLSYNGAVNWYHFNADGGMDTGWLEIGGQTYYLYPVADGTRGYMMTGWQQIGGNWYYFSEEEGAGFGAMKRSAWIGDDYVDSDGIWVQ